MSTLLNEPILILLSALVLVAWATPFLVGLESYAVSRCYYQSATGMWPASSRWENLPINWAKVPTKVLLPCVLLSLPAGWIIGWRPLAALCRRAVGRGPATEPVGIPAPAAA